MIPQKAYLAIRLVEMLRDPEFKGTVLSDEDLKLIEDMNDPKEVARAIISSGPPYSENEIRHVLKYMEDEGKSFDQNYNFEKDGHMWSDDVLDKYAEHIYNYRYTYKPEAQAINPEIDPEEEHIGPMAQDIEQVNPACIEETPEGVKTVDTGRLALMNAGAIAELAREIKELRNG